MGNLIDTEPIGVSVGRVVVPVAHLHAWQSSPVFDRLFSALNGLPQQGLPKPEILRRNLVFSLNDNTACDSPLVGHTRSVSAYFTYDPNAEEVIIEWGIIDPQNGIAKLHDYLDRAINYSDRVRQGMKLSSGHIARIIGAKQETYFALIDNLPECDARISSRDPMGKLINTLHLSGFIPITPYGHVRLPVF